MMKENLQKNFFRYKKIKGHFFLTTDFGTWCILNKSEFEFFNSKPLKALDKKLLKKLKSALIIINKKDLNRITDLYFNKYKAIYNGPTLFVIFITNKCNFKCKYCFASANITKNVPNKINNNELANLIKIITFILNTPQKNINIEFQGGEPLLKFELIKKAIFQAKKMNNKFKKNIKFSITTNFSLLTDEIIDYLNKENIQISGSLDGEKDLHNANRIFADGKGTYDLVNNKIQYLTTKLLKKFSLLSVVTKNSLGKEKEIVDTIIKNNRKIVILNQIRYTGRAIKGNNWSDIGITDDEYLVFWKKLINYIFKLNQKGIFITERYFDIALAKLFSSSEPNFLDWRSPCGAIIGQITFDIDGNIYPCHEANNNKELILGNVNNSSYKEVLIKEISQQIIQNSILEGTFCDFCTYKPFCGICPICSFNQSRNFSTQLWKFNSQCLIYKGMFDFIIEMMINKPEKIMGSLMVSNFLNK